MSTTTATTVVQRARRGDAEARDQLVADHLETVRAVCASRLSSPHDVADATQETFLRALPRLEQVRDPAAVGAWLAAIAVRVCADHGRATQQRRWVDGPSHELASDDAGPFEIVAAEEDADRLRANLARLAPRDRTALWMRDAIGLPIADVASGLGVTEGSARVLLVRARRRLRDTYAGLGAGVAIGWLRLRQRLGMLAEPGAVDLRAALAAQVAIAVAAAVVAVPRTDAGDPGGGRVPETAAVDDAAGASSASGVDVGTLGRRGDGPAVPYATGPRDAGDRSDPPSARPPVVEVGPEPSGPSSIGIATSDGEGSLAGVEVFGVAADDDGGSADADGNDDGEDDDGDTRDDIVLGPVVVDPGGLVSGPGRDR